MISTENSIPMFKMMSIIALLSLYTNSFSMSVLPEFSAACNTGKKAVVFKWQHTIANIKTYIIQQSSGNKIWADIALQEVTQAAKPRSFYFEHKKITGGENHYRLKYINTDGSIDYSLVVIVIIGGLNNSWVIYPIPVADLLTLEYRGSEPIRGVIHVIIQQPTGRVFTKLRYSSLSRLIKIPVNNLPKGIYDIRIIVQDDVIWDQRFIK
jgi:hypothetical protein